MLENLGIDLSQVLGQVLTLVIMVVIPALARLVGKLISEKIKETDNALLAKVAGMGVMWVEQKFKGIESSEKFDKAYEYIESKLEKIGVDVDKDDIEKVIEATLQSFSQSVGEIKN